MNTGIDKVIIDSKMSIAKAVNDAIQQGVPCSVIAIILENISMELNIFMSQLNQESQNEDIEKYFEDLPEGQEN